MGLCEYESMHSSKQQMWKYTAYENFMYYVDCLDKILHNFTWSCTGGYNDVESLNFEPMEEITRTSFMSHELTTWLL